MRWPAPKQIDSRPLDGALRYRIKFAWTPVKTTSAVGPSIQWDSEIIWLEKVVEVQEYRRCQVWGGRSGEWNHNRWYPINDFTLALHEHNNQ